MNIIEIEDRDVEFRSWIEEVQAKAIEAAAGEIARACAVSLPVPGQTSGGGRTVAVFLYPITKATEPRLNQVFEPDVVVALDPVSMEISEVKRIRVSFAHERELPLGLDRNDAVRSLSSLEWDSLQSEFYALHEYLIDRFLHSNFDSEQRNIHRWGELFSLLIPASLRPYYEKIAPEFFARLESIASESLGSVGKASIDDRPERAVGQDSVELSNGRSFQLPAHEIAWDVIESALYELGLVPAPVSPLTELEPRPHKRGLGFLLGLFPDSSPADWRRIFQTLCAPESEVEVVYGNEGFAAKTSFFSRVEGRQSFWVRLTAKPVESEGNPGAKESTNATYVISFPHDLDVIKGVMIVGLKSKGIPMAEQIVRTISLAEWITIVALADLWTEGQSLSSQRIAEPISAPLLAGMWQGLEKSPIPTWCLTAAVAFPGILPACESLITEGLASLEAQQWLIRDSSGLKAAPKLRALIRSFQQPLAHGSLQVRHYDDNRVVVRGFTGVRTDRKLWIWEAAESFAAESPLEKAQISIFQVTHKQFVAILAHLLELWPMGPDDKREALSL